MRTMVNETRIYSDFQNLPYTTLFNVISVQTPVIITTIPAGKIELKISGQMLPDANTGERRITLGTMPILAWSNASDNPDFEYKETTLELNLNSALGLSSAIVGSVNAPPLAYQIAYRSTPSLELISSAELDAKNQAMLKLNQEIMQDYIEKDNQKNA